jgi:hypothetical protein
MCDEPQHEDATQLTILDQIQHMRAGSYLHNFHQQGRGQCRAQLLANSLTLLVWKNSSSQGYERINCTISELVSQMLMLRGELY